MRLNKLQLLLALFVILGAIYAFNIFSVNKISSLIIEKPAKVSFTVIVPDKDQCGSCFDAALIVSSIDSLKNVKVTSKKVVTADNLIFENLIDRYKIKNLPAIVVSGDISDQRIFGIWESLQGKEESGNMVIQNLLPFYDLAQEKPKGIVEAILLKDKTCQKCFDESQYLGAVRRLGLFVGSSRVYDIASSEGYALARKYNISKVPALLLSSDANDYPGFASLWEEVGTQEEDGWFVFREVQKVGEYQNFKF
jgi:hypothetical protein